MQVKNKAWIWPLIIIAAAIGWKLMGGGSAAILLDAGDTTLTLHAPSDYALTAEYAEIMTMSVVETPEQTVLEAGVTERNIAYGERNDPRYGLCEICILDKVPVCICLQTVDRTLLFNYESEDSTRTLFDALAELLRENGYTVDVLIS